MIYICTDFARIPLLPTSYSQCPWLWSRFPGKSEVPPSPQFPQFSKLEEKVTPPLFSCLNSQLPYLPSISKIHWLLCQTFYSHLDLNLILTIIWQKDSKEVITLHIYSEDVQAGKVEGKIRTQSPGSSRGDSHSATRVHTRQWSWVANSRMLSFRFWSHHLLDDGFG